MTPLEHAVVWLWDALCVALSGWVCVHHDLKDDLSFCEALALLLTGTFAITLWWDESGGPDWTLAKNIGASLGLGVFGLPAVAFVGVVVVGVLALLPLVFLFAFVGDAVAAAVKFSDEYGRPRSGNPYQSPGEF